MARRQRGKLDAPHGEKRVVADNECIGRRRERLSKAVWISPLVVALKICICNAKACAAASTSFSSELGVQSIGRIDEHGHTHCSRHQLT